MNRELGSSQSSSDLGIGFALGLFADTATAISEAGERNHVRIPRTRAKPARLRGAEYERASASCQRPIPSNIRLDGRIWSNFLASAQVCRGFLHLKTRGPIIDNSTRVDWNRARGPFRTLGARERKGGVVLFLGERFDLDRAEGRTNTVLRRCIEGRIDDGYLRDLPGVRESQRDVGPARVRG